jgi:hypothetical protein
MKPVNLTTTDRILWTADRIIMSLNVQYFCTVMVLYQKEIYILAPFAYYKHTTSP